MAEPAMQPGFRDAAREAQDVFRAVMNAMARPARIIALSSAIAPPRPLAPEAAAIILTLADFETPLWLDEPLRKAGDAAAYLRFYTGARIVADPKDASFAVVSSPAVMPPLAAFAQGRPDYPDRSATLVLQASRLRNAGWRLAGPGIDGEILFEASVLPSDFEAQLKENHAGYPLGVDLIFVSQDAIAALPRSTRILGAD